MNINDFFIKYNGKYIDFDKQYRYQCTDLIRQYILEVLGWQPYTAIPTTGAAKNIFNNFSDNEYFTKIKNTPTNTPSEGDIVFWGYYPFVTGWSGHVAINSSAVQMSLITFDQNYPSGSSCKFVRHSYKGVLGWLHPKAT